MLDLFFFFFFKQKTAYEMRISDWSSDVCSSDLLPDRIVRHDDAPCGQFVLEPVQCQVRDLLDPLNNEGAVRLQNTLAIAAHLAGRNAARGTNALRPLHDRRNRNLEPTRHRTATVAGLNRRRSEEHTSALQSLMRISYA